MACRVHDHADHKQTSRTIEFELAPSFEETWRLELGSPGFEYTELD